jgi:hypothetical protein
MSALLPSRSAEYQREVARADVPVSHRRRSSSSVPVGGGGSRRCGLGLAGGLRDGVTAGAEDVPEGTELVQVLAPGAAGLESPT